ncbi:hypothetical protein ElyMa_001513900 [Elysia marginata]|uniref:Uncharacterized protein n=1 Tax=Elysia marginata TaxID=1093978 RepID=A0AAV4JC13_9GAST|nr:hypothetical protein ElyMa_001513900 [Elysia marginata]
MREVIEFMKFKKEFRNVFSCNRRQSRYYNNDSTLFHCTRMVRRPNHNHHHHHHYQPTDSNQSEPSSTHMLRGHDLATSSYPGHRVYNGHRMLDGHVLVNGDQV